MRLFKVYHRLINFLLGVTVMGIYVEEGLDMRRYMEALVSVRETMEECLF